MKTTAIKILGIAASVIGVGATLLSDWVSELSLNEKIEEKVNDAMTLKNQEEDKEEVFIEEE